MLSNEINSLFDQNSSILKIINYQIRSLSNFKKLLRLENELTQRPHTNFFNISISIKNSEIKS